ncbi:MAG: ribonuclease HI family protein [Endomicrobia bacterium]|nr:ribonuclease HI family protein [Endomicrobiia bacterium]MCX7941208.1 ribonuclease HI family protein [Endomicrobiia bacterium]MDW8056155.1 ribonuclease HI family protein [Elusimicrobiota bacterium]
MKYKLYFDGNKTPQGVSCSYIVQEEKGKRIIEETKLLDKNTTVPEAEYHGVIKGLERFIDYCKEKNINLNEVELEVYGDSQLVIKQLTGEYECKKPNLRVLRSKVRYLSTLLGNVNFFWVERKDNLAR